MTSRISFSKVFKICLKNHIWSIALSCLLLFLAMPIYTALYVSIIIDRLNMGWFPAQSMCKFFRLSVYSPSNEYVQLATLLLAVIIAMNSFGFLFSKQKVDLYHSLPVKRDTWYAANYLSGIATFIIPYCVFQIIAMIIGAVNGLLDGVGVGLVFVSLFINILGFLCFYSLTVIAIMLTGTLPVAIIATGVVLAYTNIIQAMFEMCKTKFFITYVSWYNDPKFYWTPFTAFTSLDEGIDAFNGRFDINFARIIVFVVGIVFFICIGYLLYRLRDSEAAGKSIAFKKAIPVISIVVLIPVAVLGGMGLEALAGSSESRVNVGWLATGVILALVIGHFILQAIYYRDFKSLFKNIPCPVIAGVFAVIILTVFGSDVIGYDAYVPSQEKLESVAINGNEFQSYEEYFNFDAEEGMYGGKDYWVGSDTYRFEHMAITDYSFIEELQKAALEDSKDYNELLRQRNGVMFSAVEDKAVDYPAQEDNLMRYKNIILQYSLNNGKKIYRNYFLDIEKHRDIYMKMFALKEYKMGVFDILNKTDEELSGITFADAFGDCEVRLSAAQQKKLLAIYREELLSQESEEIAKVSPIGYIYLPVNMNEDNYVAHYFVAKSFVYPSFTRTIDYLKSVGISMDRYLYPDNISEITITWYNYDDYDSEANTVTYTQKKDIEQLMPVLVPGELTGDDNIFRKYEQLDVMVKFKTAANVYQTNGMYYLFPKGTVPEYVVNALGY